MAARRSRKCQLSAQLLCSLRCCCTTASATHLVCGAASYDRRDSEHGLASRSWLGVDGEAQGNGSYACTHARPRLAMSTTTLPTLRGALGGCRCSWDSVVVVQRKEEGEHQMRACLVGAQR